MTDLVPPTEPPRSDACAPQVDAPAEPDWERALDRLLREPQRVRVQYQPIVDLQRGVVRGYEALARFPEAPDLAASEWFAAAARHGRAGALEAQVVSAALVVRPLLVRDRFIALNMSPAALASPEMARVLAGSGRLDAIVVEVTPGGAPAREADVLAAAEELRARGAGIAIDDAGVSAGAEHLERIAALRPRFIKVEGGLTRRIAASPTRAGVMRALLDLAAGLDACLIAEGIEDEDQLDAVARLGVPLGQGFALGRPAPAMAELDRGVARRLRERTLRGVRDEGIARLVVRLPGVVPDPSEAAAAFDRDPRLEHVVVLDRAGCAIGILDRVACARGDAPRRPLSVLPATALDDLVRRALARPLAERWDPVVCIDGGGTYQGVVPLERVVATLTAGV